ncbi:cadmium, cobalt and zinc/H(+)-K(+) antiporter [Variibacter gotjawalensis]|uniref:Cadmium, cobalt and zinc/H(+)-K(+) antiporter n=1 Tax=Variibacter gotjawalensis TaxID=1333996 RepID=A0A0S3PYJ6_9BRAD|nr:cation diffusion facilitator family transporter [Variibacter gotjawalensis]NIK46815.1 cobalt-zinc-cadmium efflux system protein [Variibacter gotjawalensis]RZS48719.1 cobalt-zinc-cadmium efflux system protein [Variibacter gotjawalensis]BAT60978.1 cadmium, cobalt and zinc/H(+)-K(+) antiporter [Variibacter gotjawalensis]
MHGGHDHGHASKAGQHRGRLVGALLLTTGYMVAEVVGGLITGSLALLADAAHMLTDAGGLALALIAIRFAERDPTPQKTYGYLRAEILAALANATVLLLLTAFILYEAYRRFVDPPEILGWPMLLVASVGLVVNLISMKLLAAGSSESINVKGAYFEVFADMLGSVGVIIAAIIVMTTGWTLADPIIGAAIGLFIVPRTWRLLMQAVHILLEGVPSEIDLVRLSDALKELSDVRAVHDLHVWTITSGMDSLCCHLVVDDMADAKRILRAARTMLHTEFSLDHVTIQIEDEELRAEEPVLKV